MEKIVIASDHAGFVLKSLIKERFDNLYEFIDLGADSAETSVDYPDFGKKLGEAIENGVYERGVLVCGTGIGISIAANRFPSVRAANCTNSTMARLTRQHNNANVLALGERLVGSEVAFDIVETFLNTDYEGGRHDRRVNKLSE